MLTTTIHAARTNYDRYETLAGVVYSGREIERLRADGFAFVILDRTPADQGLWHLDPLADYRPRPTQTNLF